VPNSRSGHNTGFPKLRLRLAKSRASVSACQSVVSGPPLRSAFSLRRTRTSAGHWIECRTAHPITPINSNVQLWPLLGVHWRSHRGARRIPSVPAGLLSPGPRHSFLLASSRLFLAVPHMAMRATTAIDTITVICQDSMVRPSLLFSRYPAIQRAASHRSHGHHPAHDTWFSTR